MADEELLAQRDALETQLFELNGELESVDPAYISEDDGDGADDVADDAGVAAQDFSTVVLVDNLPKVDEGKLPKLLGVLGKIYGQVGEFAQAPYMPLAEDGKTAGFALLDFQHPAQAQKAVQTTDGWKLDARHVFKVRAYAEVLRVLGMSEAYAPLEERSYAPRPDPNAWLMDDQSRDQFCLRYGKETEVVWTDTEANLDTDYDGGREKSAGKTWCEQYVMWSPDGQYLATFHQQGIALWGGKGYEKYRRFAHPAVQAIEFSPCGRFLVTYGQHAERAAVVWHISSTRVLRFFSKAQMTVEGRGLCKLKWASSGNLIAKLGANMLSVYVLPSMKLHLKASIRADGIRDFCWSPTANIVAYWSPGANQTPARVVMTLCKKESRDVIREKNLFTVKDCRLDWHPQGRYLAVKATRTSKTGKTQYTNFELFRARETAVPVDSLEQSERVVAFAFEPNGHRFAVAHGDGNVLLNVTFYTMAGGGDGSKLEQLFSLKGKKCNRLYWSPQGRYIVLAGLGDGMNGVLEFWDADTQTMMSKEQEHYRCSHVSWDPSGRILCTAVCQSLDGSYYKSMMDNGYCLWSFQGTKIKEVTKDAFYQFLWRPRPRSLLSEAKRADVVKNLRKYEKRYQSKDKDLKRARREEKLRKKRAVARAFYQRMIPRFDEYRDATQAAEAEILGYDPNDPANPVAPFEDSTRVIETQMGKPREEVVGGDGDGDEAKK